MAITPLPTPPSRSDPANFADRGDAFLGALPTFATEANALATATNQNEINAELAETNAEAAQVAAELAQSAAEAAQLAAETAETNAAQSALEAEGLVENYQGALGSDPSLNKDGGALVAGDWYVNTATGFIRAYTGSVWVQGISAVSGVSSLDGEVGDLTLKTVSGQDILGTGNIEIASADFEEFTTSGTWTKPAGIQFVMVEVWGAGGGGGSGRRISSATNSTTQGAVGGGGGGGGSYFYQMYNASDLGSTVDVVVGAGGSGGAAQTVNFTNGLDGSAGGSSSFGSLSTRGGGGGAGGSIGSGSGGTGGLSGPYNIPTMTGPFNGGSGIYGGSNGVSSNATAYPSQVLGNTWWSGAGGGCGGTQIGINDFSGAASFQARFAGIGGTNVQDFPIVLLNKVYPGTNGETGVGFVSGGGGASNYYGQRRQPVSDQVACFGNSLFAVTTTDGMIVTSSNGTTGWTYKSPPNGVQTPWILHDGTQFVLFSVRAEKCWTTTDFSTYTEKTGVSGIVTLRRVKYVNSRYFLAHDGGLLQSTDLVTWTVVNSGNGGTVFDIAWTGTNYVVVSTSDDRVRISSDLTSWSTPTGIVTSGGVYSCESDGAGDVVIQTNLTPFAQLSTDDGATFANVTTTLTTAINSRSLAYLNSTWLLAGLDTVWSSTDGDTWTQRIFTGNGWTGGGFAYNGTTYINGFASNEATIVRSATNVNSWAAINGPTALTTSSGGNGGNAGIAGGGGGGGGSVAQNSGAGGNGGNGLVRVYSW